MSSVELEKLRDVEVKHFLQSHKTVFTKQYYPNGLFTCYEIVIDMEYEKLGQRQFYRFFNISGGYVIQADVLEAFDARVRIACAILHWEILCWEKSAFNINGTLSSRD